MEVRGAFNHLLRPGLRKDFRDSYQSFPDEYSLFLKVGSQTEAEIRAVAVSGLGRMARKSEVGVITYVDAKESPKVTFVDDEFALGFEISKRLVEDDLYGRANQNAKWLGRAARLTQEFQAAALLDDAFTGTTYKGLYSEALCSATHTLLNGSGTWSNLVSGNPQLSYTGLQAALELSEAQVDHEGNPMPMMARKLLVDRTNEFMAIRLCQGDWEPDTADRNMNALKTKVKGLSYELLHYKSANGKWFVQDSNLIDMHFDFRIKPQFGDSQDEGGTLAARYWARQRINVYFFDQRGIIGSNC